MTQASDNKIELLHLETVDENRNIVLQLAQQARRELLIFSQTLDAPLYDNAEFERAVFELARLHPSTQIRILVQDVSGALHHGHRLLRQAQQLTSSVFIRRPSRDYKDEAGAFIVADGRAYLQRIIGNQYSYTATASLSSPKPAAQLKDHFNKIWELAEDDPQLRRLYV